MSLGRFSEPMKILNHDVSYGREHRAEEKVL